MVFILLTAGHVTTLRVPLTRRLRSVLAHGRLVAQVTVAAVGPSGRMTASRTITLTR